MDASRHETVPLQQRSAKGDFRAYLPRFTGEQRERNERLLQALRQIADDKGVTPAQLCTAWVLGKGRSIVPLIGSRSRAQLKDALGALEVHLSAEEIARLEAALPASVVAGSRYDERQMQMLASER